MHLTPRTLGLAVAATETACTVLGIMTSLDLASAHPNAHNAPATGPATAPAALAAAFGDSAGAALARPGINSLAAWYLRRERAARATAPPMTTATTTTRARRRSPMCSHYLANTATRMPITISAAMTSAAIFTLLHG